MRIIENGSATGIRLKDGSEVGARKLVVSAGLSPEQLVFDMIGREVAVLVDEARSAGSHRVRFDAGSLASGVYMYELTAGSFSRKKKMILMR